MATCFHPYSPEDIQRTQELKELTELFAPMFGTALSANINDIIGAWQETKEARGMLPSNEDFFEFLFNGVYNKPQVPKQHIKEVVASHVEMAEIRAEAIKNGTYLKAPNGTKSNLDERQWLQARTKAFKKWFGDWTTITQNEDGTWNIPDDVSKVIELETGEPLVVYHGSVRTKEEAGYVVSLEYFATPDIEQAASYTGYRDYEDSNRNEYIRSVFMNLKNPLIIDNKGAAFSETRYKGSTINSDALIEIAKKEGHDGFMLYNTKDFGDNIEAIDTTKKLNPSTFAAFNTSNQIKSATDNIGTYSKDNDDIRYYKTGEEEFDKAFADFKEKSVKQIDNTLEKGKDYTIDKLIELFDKTSTDKEQQELAKKVFSVAKKLNFKVQFLLDNLGFLVAGVQNFDTLQIARVTTLERNKERLASVLLHETIHGVTTYAIQAYKNKELTNPKLIEAVEELINVYEAILNNEELKNEYGLTNIEELIAELPNPVFRNKLKKINIWDRLKNAIKKIFFFFEEEDVTAYTVLSDALDKFLDNYDVDLWNTYNVSPSDDSSDWNFMILDNTQAVQKHEGNWSRKEAADNPNILYVFTDNTDRDSGSGKIPDDSWYSKKYGVGHHYPRMTAAVVRGLENARPISTQKWYHSGATGPKGNWTDNDIEEFTNTIREELEEIVKEFNTGKYDTIMFPAGDSLFNTTISNITKTRTPKLYQALADLLHEYGFDSLIPTDVTSTSTSIQTTQIDSYPYKVNKTNSGNVIVDPNLTSHVDAFHEKHPEGIIAYRVAGKYTFNTVEEVEKGHIGNPFSVSNRGEVTVKQFYDWLTTGTTFGNLLATEEYRQAIIKKLLETPSDAKILYYKELNRTSHANVIDYLIQNKHLLPNTSTPNLAANDGPINYITLEDYLVEHNNKIKVNNVNYIIQKTEDANAPYIGYREGLNGELTPITAFELKNVLAALQNRLQLGLNEKTNISSFEPSETSVSTKNKLNEAVEEEQLLGEKLNLTAPQIEEIEDILLYELLEYAYDARSFKGKVCVWLENQLKLEEVSDEQKAIYAEALQQISLFKKIYSDYNNILPKELQKSSFTDFLSGYLRDLTDINTFVEKLATKFNITPEHPRYQEFINANLPRMQIYFSWVQNKLENEPEQYEKIEDIFIKNVYSKFEQLTGYKISYKRKKAANTKESQTSIEETVANTFGGAFGAPEQLKQELETTSVQTEDLSAEDPSDPEELNTDAETVGEAYAQGSFEDSLKQSSFSTLSSSLKLLYAMYLKQGYYNNEGNPVHTNTLVGRRKSVNPIKVHGILAQELANCTTFDQMMKLLKGRLKTKYVWAELLADLLTGTRSLGYSDALLKQLQNQFFNAYRKETNSLVIVNHTPNNTYVDELGTHSGTQQLYDALHETFNSAGYITYSENNSLYNSDGTLNIMKLSEDQMREFLNDIFKEEPDKTKPVKIDRAIRTYKENQGDQQGNIYRTPLESLCWEASLLSDQIIRKRAKEDISEDLKKLSECFQKMLLGIGVPVYKFPELIACLEDPEILMAKDAQGIEFFKTLLNTLNYFSAPPMYLHEDKILYENHSHQTEDDTKIDTTINGQIQQVTVEIDKKEQAFEALYNLKEGQKGKASFAWDIKTLYRQNYSNLFRLLGPYVAPTVEGMVQERGKTYYPFQPSSYGGNLISDLANASNLSDDQYKEWLKQTFSKDPLLATVDTKGTIKWLHPILKHLYHNPKDAKLIKKRTIKFVDRKESKDWTDLDYLMLMEDLANKRATPTDTLYRTFLLPVISDKQAVETVISPVTYLFGGEDLFNANSFTESGQKAISNILEAEYNRIAKFSEIANEINKGTELGKYYKNQIGRSYLDRAATWTVFPELNDFTITVINSNGGKEKWNFYDLITKQKESTEEIIIDTADGAVSTSPTECIYSTLYELLDRRFNRFQAKLKQESDLAKQAGKLVKGLEGFGEHQSLKNLYVWDTLQQAWWSQLLLGDGANYKNAVDMTKRTNQMHSGTNKINTGNPELTGNTYDSGKLIKETYVVLADPQAKSEHRDKEIAQIIKNLKLSPAEKKALESVWQTTMELTNGLSVRNLASYKKILIMAGMDSLEIERVFNNFKNGKFVYADLEKILVSLKPFYVGEEIQIVKDKNGKEVYTSRKILQHKNQEALLCIRDILRTAANNSGFYRELQTFMEENNIDLVLFDTNVKVGGTPAIPLGEDIKELSEGNIEGRPLSEYLKETIITNSFFKKERALKYYGISTATDDHLTDKSRTRGTQMVRLMLSDLKVIEEENTPEYKQFVNNYKQICLNKGLLELEKGPNENPYYDYTNTFIKYVYEKFGIYINDYTKDEAFPFLLDCLMTNKESEFKYATPIKKRNSEKVFVFGEDSEENTTLEEVEQETTEWKEQTLKLNLTPIYYKVGDKQFTSLELRIKYQQLLLEGVRRAKKRFNESFKSIEDVQKLIFDFIDSSNRYSAELKECFKIVERNVKGKKVKEFALGFGDPLRAHDLEPLLLALVKDRILTQTTRGGEAVQVSSVGATDLHMRFQNSDGAFIFNEKEWNDPSLAEASMRDTLNGLKKKYSSYEAYSNSAEGQAGSIAYLECYLPPHLKGLVKYALVKKTTDEGSYYELDSSNIPEGLRTAIGYRIPTENKYSITNLRIKGFLPPGSATVMLPHEWLILSGSDFDIDKLYLIFKELKKTNPDLDQFFQKEKITYNGEIKETSYWEIFLTNIQHDFLKEHGEHKKKILDELRKAKSTKDVNSILKDYKGLDFKGFLEQFENTLIALWQAGHNINIFPYEVPEFNWDAAMEDQTMAQCNNAVFDIMQAIMASKESVNTILQSNNIKPLVELAADISVWKNLSTFEDHINQTLKPEEAASLGEGLTHLENKNAASKYSEPIWNKLSQIGSETKNSFLSTVTSGKDFYDITDRVTRWRNNMDGANLIAPHAIHNVHIGVAQGINYPIKPFTINGITYRSLSNKYNADGALISPALAMNVAGAVDNGKHPTLGALMQHPKVVHITDYMLRAGVDIKSVVLFLSHPDISNILNLSRYSDKSVRALILQAIRNLETSYANSTGQKLLGLANFNPSAQDLAMACLDPKFIEKHNLKPSLLEASARLQMLRVLEKIEQGAMDLSNQVRGSRSDSLKNASYIYKYADKQKNMDKALGKTNNPNAIYLKGLNDMGWHTVMKKYGLFHPIIKNLESIQELTKSYTLPVLNEWMLNYQYFQLLQLSFFNDMSAEKLHIDTSNVENKTLKTMLDKWNEIPDFDSLEAKQRWFSLDFPAFVNKTLKVLRGDFAELFMHDNTLKVGMKTRSFLLDLQVSNKTKKRARQSIGISNFKHLKLQEGYLSTIQKQVVDMSEGKGILNEQIAKSKGLTPNEISILNRFLTNLINNLFIFEVMTSAFERSTNSIASIFGAQYLTNIPGYGEVLQKGDDRLMRVYHTQFILNKLGRVGFVKEISPESEDGKRLLDIIQKYKKGESTVVPKEYWDNLSFGSQSEIVKIKDKTKTVFVGCMDMYIMTKQAQLGVINSMGKYGTFNQYNPFMSYPLFEIPAFMQDAEALYFPMEPVFSAMVDALQTGSRGQLVVELDTNKQVVLTDTETKKVYTVSLQQIQEKIQIIKDSENIC